MKTGRRWIMALIGAAALTAVLAGCGGTGGQAAPDETPGSAQEETEGQEEVGAALTGLTMEDPAQLAELDFDPVVTEYDITVFEDVYGLRFTPSIEGGGVVTVSMSGSGIEDETVEAADGEPFELHLTQDRECSASATRGMEDDCDYTVSVAASDETYTIHVHRPGTDALVEQFERRTWDLGDGHEMTWWLYVPEDYDPDQAYPVVVCPHGGGQFPVDAEDILVRTAQATTFAKYGKDVIVIAPHGNYTTLDYDGPYASKWADDDMTLSPFAAATLDILASVEEEFHVDPDRVYVAGASQGGRAAVALICNAPDTFAAALIGVPAFDGVTTVPEGEEPVPSEDAVASAARLAEIVKEQGIAVWLIHAETDPTVDIEATRTLQAAFDAADVSYESIILPAGTYLSPTDHFSWVPVFDNEACLDALLAQSK